ncbi:DNA polymerase III subunit delta' C-terminal domain-containing protein [Legionella micdadei]|uniref:DNA polymerase III subunit delta' n=1 Tax=Legionella micdadei TaxID=451 RepID=A0A098GGA6_LEGMI|nr:DNA polymerase III subunit delta' C-terminal domain-containing protein [Legionella micdadei]ARG97489.1 hypothetical protein B6N58_07320 [Legionella micdadei]KTD28386.1 DNA polymerase III, delta' subunit [Legionella micdadei]NSL17013.1 hypothetical protein [Legionella micdadei]CEG61022.1 putative DNA polymerase III delta prime subunit [Legionella micdadei]SCY70588.1 DNA polymerase-3 subunit delta' [Legionella micdadei]
MQSIKASELSSSLWERFQSISAKQRIPHALLLVGMQSKTIIEFAYKIAAALLCFNEQKPCGFCKSCRLLQIKEHPDLCFLEPDKAGGNIKIDQIRDLHDLAFTSAQLAGKRVIIISPAEKMNIAAANALLKLLEEPPEAVNFILIAEQISTLPATIISRCQQWRFSSTEYIKADYLTTGEEYSAETERGILFSQLPTIIADLNNLMINKLSVCTLAEKWLAHDFSSLMWLIYLIHAQLIDYKFNGNRSQRSWTQGLNELAQHFKITHLFKQLDQVNEIRKKIHQNIAFNQNLMLESLLLAYKNIDHYRIY